MEPALYQDASPLSITQLSSENILLPVQRITILIITDSLSWVLESSNHEEALSVHLAIPCLSLSTYQNPVATIQEWMTLISSKDVQQQEIQEMSFSSRPGHVDTSTVHFCVRVHEADLCLDGWRCPLVIMTPEVAISHGAATMHIQDAYLRWKHLESETQFFTGQDFRPARRGWTNTQQ